MSLPHLIDGLLDDMADAEAFAAARDRAARRVHDALRLGGLWRRWLSGIDDPDERRTALADIQAAHDDLALDPVNDLLADIAQNPPGPTPQAWTDLAVHACTAFATPTEQPLALLVAGPAGGVKHALVDSACFGLANNGCAVVVDHEEFARIHPNSFSSPDGVPTFNPAAAAISIGVNSLAERIFQTSLQRLHIAIIAKPGMASWVAQLHSAGHRTVAIVDIDPRSPDATIPIAVADSVTTDPEPSNCEANPIPPDRSFDVMQAIETATELAHSGSLDELIVLGPGRRVIGRLGAPELGDRAGVLAAMGFDAPARAATPDFLASAGPPPVAAAAPQATASAPSAPARFASPASLSPTASKPTDRRKIQVNLPPQVPPPFPATPPAPVSPARSSPPPAYPLQSASANREPALSQTGDAQRLGRAVSPVPAAPDSARPPVAPDNSERVQHRRSQIRKLCDLGRVPPPDS